MLILNQVQGDVIQLTKRELLSNFSTTPTRKLGRPGKPGGIGMRESSVFLAPAATSSAAAIRSSVAASDVSGNQSRYSR